MILDQDQPPTEPAAPLPRTRRRIRAAGAARQRRRRILSWLLLGISSVLMVNALLGENGYLATLRARREYDALQAELARTQMENQHLQEAVERMREDPIALEEVARGELGLLRPGEALVVVTDAPAPDRD